MQLAKAAGTTLAVHENFRFQPWYRRLREELNAKRLGTLYQVRFALRPGDGQGPLAYLDRQPYFQSMERFLVRETGIHFIDVFRYLCGEPQAAWADLRRLNPAIAGEDAGLFVLEYGDGLRAVFDGNRLSDHAAEDHRLTLGEMTLEGEHGTLILNGRGELQWRRKGQTESRRLPCEWKAAGPGGDSVFRYQQHVIDHLERGSTLENRADDYLRNLEIEEIIYRSSAAGRRLTC